MPSQEHERIVREVARKHLDEVIVYDRAIPATLATYKPQREGQKYARPDALGYRDGELAVVEVDQVERGVFREQVYVLGTNEQLHERMRVLRERRSPRLTSGERAIGGALVGAGAGFALNKLLGLGLRDEQAAGVGGLLGLAAVWASR